MNTRQWLVTGATALSVIGSAGFAYAQTSSTEAVGSGSAAATPSGRVEGSTNASTTDATLTPKAATPGSTPDASNSSDLPAKADRG